MTVARGGDMTQRAIDGPYIYFVTTNTTHGQWIFDVDEHAEALGNIIRDACREDRFRLFGYCILPNHAHLLVEKTGRVSLSFLMKTIKGRTWDIVMGSAGRRIWQPRFNVRIIDSEDRFVHTVEYIRHNFQKMNLPECYGNPPFVFIDWREVRNYLG